jgi:hypothetical protein
MRKPGSSGVNPAFSRHRWNGKDSPVLCLRSADTPAIETNLRRKRCPILPSLGDDRRKKTGWSMPTDEDVPFRF